MTREVSDRVWKSLPKIDPWTKGHRITGGLQQRHGGGGLSLSHSPRMLPVSAQSRDGGGFLSHDEETQTPLIQVRLLPLILAKIRQEQQKNLGSVTRGREGM